jgi:hypothetical protein
LKKAEELKKPPITYHCKWCHKKLRGGYNSDANLRKHCDRSNQAGHNGSGCPRRHVAIKEGEQLPPTANANKALLEKNKTGDNKLTSFFGRTEKFDTKVLNQVLAIWQLRNALPWLRIEDFDLNAAFHYSNPETNLYRRKWCATEAKHLYLSL